MWTKITGFTLGAKGIAIAAAVFAVIVLWQRATIADLRTEIATLQGDLAMARANVATAVAVNDRNVIDLDRFKTDSQALRTAFAGELQRLQARCDTATKTRENIRRAKQESPATCPVAASVAAAVDGLRELIAGSADRDPDRAGDGQAPR